MFNSVVKRAFLDDNNEDENQCLWGSCTGILEPVARLAGGQTRRLQKKEGKIFVQDVADTEAAVTQWFCLMWYTPTQGMKEGDHFTNLKGSLQVLQFHVGRKSEAITDIIAPFASVGQIHSEDEALEAQGLCLLDQLPRDCPVAVDVELEPPKATRSSCSDLFQRAGRVGAGNVTGAHRFGRFVRYWKIIRMKVTWASLPDNGYDFLFVHCSQRKPELLLFVYPTKDKGLPAGKYISDIKNSWLCHMLL